MDYRCVIAIDAGYKNFAWCFLDSNIVKKPFWQRQCLWHGRAPPDETSIIAMTLRWLEGHRELLNIASAIVLEKQMRTPFQVMNAVIHSQYFDKCQQVDPRTIGAYWHLPRKREAKKEAGIETVRANGVEIPNGKCDDVCDAWLMARWKLVDLEIADGLDPVVARLEPKNTSKRRKI